MNYKTHTNFSPSEQLMS